MENICDIYGNHHLTRYGLGKETDCYDPELIDLLEYNYDADDNRLHDVWERLGTPAGFDRNLQPSSASYSYDDNGNLTHDLYKSLTITYNHLNLPETFTLPDRTITVVYTATGQKLRQTTTPTTGTATVRDYSDRLEYVNGTLESLYHAHGRLLYTGPGSPEYQYVLTDHLGNARVTVVDKDGNGRIAYS